jgi:molybdopterin-guanine dinucleotide biosynthesis protein A
MQIGGIILCGGQSSRMGRAKAALPFGNELMLPRVARILGEVVAPVVVVAGPDQDVPPLPAAVRIVRDEQEYLGPLAGLAVGLSALAGEVDAAYCSACDVPLLKPDFIRAVIAALGDHDAAVPRAGEFYHPLAGVYRTALADPARRLVAEGRLRPLFLLESCRAAAIAVETLRAADPDLSSLRNINHPDDYAAALRAAGLPPPQPGDAK